MRDGRRTKFERLKKAKKVLNGQRRARRAVRWAGQPLPLAVLEETEAGDRLQILALGPRGP